MSKELIVDKFKLITNKIPKDSQSKKILILSDLHIGKNTVNEYGKEALGLIERYLEDNNDINMILVPGDLVNGAKSYLNSGYIDQLKYYMQMFGEKAPTIVSKGNHDLYGTDDEIAKKFKSLESLNNVYPLDNEQVTLNNITFTGFSPSLPAYNIMNYGKKANNVFVQDWQNANFNFNSNETNILLAHDPITISSNEALQEISDDLKNITMIASGHLHNGFITTAHERRSKFKLSDGGYWESPLTGFKIDTCRGAYMIGKGVKGPVYLPEQEYYKIINGTYKENQDKALLVVSKGVNKYPLSKWGGDPCITEVVLEAPNYYDEDLKNDKSKAA